MPVGLGLNFVINGRGYAVPMAVEEPSVVAAASNAAKVSFTFFAFACDRRLAVYFPHQPPSL